MARRAGPDTQLALSVEDARQRILARVAPLPAVETPLLDALGLVLTANISAPMDVPPFANSAMDGYAVRAVDTADASQAVPVCLTVAGAAPAGAAASVAVAASEAVRIMTGAVLPDGADAVIKIEDVRARAGEIGVDRPVRAGANVRRRGEDFAVGQTVLQVGTRFGAAELGAMAALGLASAPVHRRPRVGLLSTGDEVVPPGASLEHGQIYDCNSVALAALLRNWGAEPVLLGIALDDVGELRRRLSGSLELDLIVTSGGVSVGDFDLVQAALNVLGSVETWIVRMKPGKPLAFGKLGGVPLLGLPGNPVAALVAFLQFGRPAIMRMMGLPDVLLPEVAAVLTERLVNRGGRTLFARGRLRQVRDGLQVTPVDAQGSAQLSGLLGADALIVIPEETLTAEAGSVVRVQVLDPATVIGAMSNVGA